MTTPYYSDGMVALHHGDCLDVLRALPDNSVDSVCTDPPYGLEFMGKDWDAPWKASGTVLHDPSEVGGFQDGNGGNAYSRSRVRYGREGGDSRAFGEWCELWTAECLRVLKPGGHLLAFGGTRTWHRLACAVEDAGFEVRDSIAWLYGSGFPKSLDVSKAIDKRPGVGQHPAFALHLAERREAAGLSRADVSERVVGTRTGACWNWEHHQFPEAKWWPALRDLLELDDARWGPVIAEAERRKIGTRSAGRLAVAPGQGADRSAVDLDVTTHATDDARTWQGWGTALKPGHEPCVVAMKPLANTGILREIGSHLDTLEAACRLSVSDAARSSARTPADSPEATTATAPESAATQPEAGRARTTPTGAAAGSSAATGTSASESMAETFSSTVMSWRACWAELCDLTSTSTTATTSETTTALRTLSSSLSRLTAESTLPSATSPHGSTSIASAVDNLFASVVCGLRATLALSATEPATGSTQHSLLAEAEADRPAFEPVVVARKPLAGGTVAANVLTWGTGALNIDATRIEGDVPSVPQPVYGVKADGVTDFGSGVGRNGQMSSAPGGRWPANVVLDDTQAAALDEQSGTLTSGANPTRRGSDKFREAYGDFKGQAECTPARGVDKGGASRFFKVAEPDLTDDLPTRFRYVAKAPKSERPNVDGVAHATVKPLTLMRWLVRLVTPPGGIVLEPFAGSGTTVEACLLEGFRCIAIEKTPEYLPLILARIERANTARAAELDVEPDLFTTEATA